MSSHPSSLDKFLVAKPDILTFPSNCDFDLFGHRTPTLLAQSLFEQLQLQGIADGANFLPAVPGAKVSLELKFKLRDFSVGTTCSSPATFAFTPRKLTQSTPSKYPLSFLSELDAELALLKTPPKPPSSSLLEELHADSEEEFGADDKQQHDVDSKPKASADSSAGTIATIPLPPVVSLLQHESEAHHEALLRRITANIQAFFVTFPACLRATMKLLCPKAIGQPPLHLLRLLDPASRIAANNYTMLNWHVVLFVRHFILQQAARGGSHAQPMIDA